MLALVCLNAALMLSQSPHVGVRFETSSWRLEVQAKRALRFFERIMEFSWYEVHNDTCSIDIQDQDLVYEAGSIAWSGLIEYNRTDLATESAPQIYATLVHEFVHLFNGDAPFDTDDHNIKDKHSVMWPVGYNPPEVLDWEDIKRLAKKHRIRIAIE